MRGFELSVGRALGGVRLEYVKSQLTAYGRPQPTGAQPTGAHSLRAHSLRAHIAYGHQHDQPSGDYETCQHPVAKNRYTSHHVAAV